MIKSWLPLFTTRGCLLHTVLLSSVYIWQLQIYFKELLRQNLFVLIKKNQKGVHGYILNIKLFTYQYDSYYSYKYITQLRTGYYASSSQSDVSLHNLHWVVWAATGPMAPTVTIIYLPLFPLGCTSWLHLKIVPFPLGKVCFWVHSLIS